MSKQAETIRRFATDPKAFRHNLVIEKTGQRVRLGDVIDPWQESDFAALDPGWQRCHGRNVEAVQRAYLERPRGHSKTSDLAAMVLWALVFSPRMISGVAAAADRDQARLLRKAIHKAVTLNPWLRSFVDVQNYRVVVIKEEFPSCGSELEILASDAASSYGLTPDFVICDELTHWKSPDLWESLFSAVAKLETCMLVCISNAGVGMGTSWQWDVREAAMMSADWHFSRLDGPKASWITQQNLDEQSRLLPGRAFNRLWLNQWTTDRGDALSPADIEACTTLPGPISARSDFHFVGGLDLGVKNDHSAFVVVAVDVTAQRFAVAHCESWAPSRETGQVDLEHVEESILRAHTLYGLDGVAFDPSQALMMAQRLTKAGIAMVETPFTGPNCDRMAQVLLSMFTNRRIDLYPDVALKRDLLRLEIRERRSGFKLEAVRDEFGHCDRGIALSIALPLAEDWGVHLLHNPWGIHPAPEEIIYV